MSSSSSETHPAWLRLAHWAMAGSTSILLTSGWGIYNASPIFNFSFPDWLLLGSELKESLLWHLAFMWVLLVSVATHIVVRVMLRRGRPSLWPVTLRAVLVDLRAAAGRRLRHVEGSYNATQRLLYIAASLLLAVVVVSGFVLWKPVQFGVVTQWLGGFQSVRLLHFIAMAALSAFMLLHLTMVVLVPTTLRSMLHGRSQAVGTDPTSPRGSTDAI